MLETFIQTLKINEFLSSRFYIYDAEVGLLADDWEITPTAITLNEKVGEGAFGTVFSASIDSIIIAKSKYGKNMGGISGFDTEQNSKIAVKLLKGMVSI